MVGHLRRAGWGIGNALTGWLAAFVATLPFQLVELIRNTAPAGVLLNLAQGLALWAGFTGAICVPAALVIAAPAGVVLSPMYVRRHRRLMVFAISGLMIYQVGKRLGTWDGLAEHSSHNPFASSLFWMYSIFATVFILVTVYGYGRRNRNDS